ncbi:MAG: 2-isopropylmalate synthase [Thermoflexales bacterium]|nr:2-isopropylmalate synthase [Thermoflexales bacterium]
MEDRVIVFDTTLRDGEQSPGATLNLPEKLEIARQLARLGVDVIEAGFAIASPGDYEAVSRIAADVGQLEHAPVIASLARCNKADIDRAWGAVQSARRNRIHTFLATSDIHLQHKLRISRNDCIEQVGEFVSYARSLCADVEFSPEDAGRSDPEFLYQVLSVAVAAGATTLNIPDTVGYRTPEEYGELIAGIIRNVSSIREKGVIVSVHCHDDLGLATANTLAGIRAGARQAEVTINGIGERAGNTSLEEVVMALRTRPQFYNGADTRIDATQLVRTSKMVSAMTSIVVQPNKAIVGANAFAHEAGIHQDGMLKNAATYEIMRPESVGWNSTNLVLGKHSGRAALSDRLKQMGYDLTREELDKAFQRFKELCDKKKVVTDADLEALLADQLERLNEVYQLDHINVTTGTGNTPVASVRLIDDKGEPREDAALGNGPINAICNCINRITRVDAKLSEFHVHAVTEGIDAIANVTVRIEMTAEDGRKYIFSGRSADTDTVVATGRAYLAAVNKGLSRGGRGQAVDAPRAATV